MKFDNPDNEWLKIVASTCLGLMAGLIAEPLKMAMTDRNTRREISNAIRKDLRFIRVLLPFYRLNEYSASQVINSIGLPAYKHYWSTNRPAFYKSGHLWFLRIQCELILSDILKIKAGHCKKLEGLKSIEENVSAALKSRERHSIEKLISKCRLWRIRRKYGDRVMVHRKDGDLIPIEKVVIVDEHGKPIPEGEGKREPAHRHSPQSTQRAE